MNEPHISISPDISRNRERTHKDGIRVNKPEKESTLILNSCDQYVAVPLWKAKEMEKKHEAVILRPTDKEYVEGWEKSMGADAPVVKGEKGERISTAIQIRGKTVPVEDIGKFDPAQKLDEIKKEAARPEAAAEPDTEPEAPSFKAKARSRRFE